MCSTSETETEVVTVLNGLLYKQTGVAGVEQGDGAVAFFLAQCAASEQQLATKSRGLPASKV